MAFLLDEDVNPAAADAGRKLALDVVSVHTLGRCGFTDPEQFALATSEGRVLVTRNRDDFIKLTLDRFCAGEPHPGVIIVPYSMPNRDPGRIARALKAWDDEHGRRSVPYGIFFLDG